MLTRLHIRQLAVLEEVTLEVSDGFSVLTGETGAGKSMLVDALALALGARADSSAIRAGAERAEVTATFELDSSAPARQWLEEHDLDSGEDCLLRRVVSASGRSRGYINGRPVPMEMLRLLGEQLVEICGQHAYQSLGQRSAQRGLLDDFGQHEALCTATAEAHAAWSELRTERETLLGAVQEQRSRAELLRYQLDELALLDLGADEVGQLEQEHRRLAHASQLGMGIAETLESLHDAEEHSAQALIAAAERDIRTLAEIDAALLPAAEALDQAGIQLAEAIDELRRGQDRIEDDPARLTAVESRLGAIRDLARKHGCKPEELHLLYTRLQTELDGISASDERLAHIDAELAASRKTLVDAAGKLGAARKRAARAFSKAVSARLATLGMPGSELKVVLTPLPDDEVAAWGAEQVEFLVSTNPGQPAGPIARVASGGELSRLSLAISLVSTADHGPATLIFDEVDAGIGGAVAEIVGQCLRDLGSRRQVICVTHLAQVAAQAGHHHAVSKASSTDATHTSVRALDEDQRIEEIARMLGGIRITPRSRAHAKEMLAAAVGGKAG